MATYLDYQNQLNGLRSVHETVKTVEKVSASHLKIEKNHLLQLEKDGQLIINSMFRLSQSTSLCPNPFHEQKDKGGKILLVMASAKGLVGGIFHSLANLVLQNHNNYQEIWLVGEKGGKALDQVNIHNFISIGDWEDEDNSKKNDDIVLKIIEMIKQKSVVQFDVAYLENLSVSVQKAFLYNLLPVKNNILEKNSVEKFSIGLPIFEDGKSKMMKLFVAKHVILQLHLLFAKTKQAELSARMVTSEHAAAKAEELVNKTRLQYLTLRRNILTQQQLTNHASHIKQNV